MKKVLLLMILLISVVSAAMAVPQGSYYDKRGNLKVVVRYDGKELYLVQRDGTVIMRFSVESETPSTDEPGVIIVTLRSIGTPVEVVHYRNAYWVGEDGSVYLNLQSLPNIVTRQ